METPGLLSTINSPTINLPSTTTSGNPFLSRVFFSLGWRRTSPPVAPGRARILFAEFVCRADAVRLSVVAAKFVFRAP